MALPWFRLYHEFANDPIVQVMTESMQRRLIMVFCFKASGDLQKLDESELARAMNVTPIELAETKEVFIKKGFIDSTWEPINWKKRQTFDHGAAARVRRMREQCRNKPVTPTEQTKNIPVAVTPQIQITDTEERKETKKTPSVAGSIFSGFDLPDSIPRSDFVGYVDMRKANGKKLTPRALTLLVNKLERAKADGHDIAAMLQDATIGCWSSVYRPDESNRPHGNGNGKSKQDPLPDFYVAPPGSIPPRKARP